MSMSKVSFDEERMLTALPLARPMTIRVVQDVSGISIFGTGTLRGFTAAGNNYQEALAIFIDGLIREYYEGWLSPKPALAFAERARALHVHALLWPKGKHDECACKEKTSV